MRIKIPTIEEQMLIVARIDEKLSMYTQINDTVGTALQQASAMRQSILKQAFEGRLL